ncbi:hypothetical protein H0H93_009937 [Arthromyces matolae]|nr:hypothetical protein H0H93_009937 [Arthromyces matolae]
MSSTLTAKRKAIDLEESRPIVKSPKKKRSTSAVADNDMINLLQQNLDFSTSTTTSSIEERFSQIGRALLNDFHLVVRSNDQETVFEILELEAYFRKDGCHEDPFTHGSEEQKICGRWYFHRSPRRSNDSTSSLTSLTGYRGGSRKGLDITFGGPPPPPPTLSPYFGGSQVCAPTIASSSQVPPRGGALLRSLRRISDNTIISGPSLLVDEILRLSDASNISELVENKWERDTSAFVSTSSRPNSLFLRPRLPSGSQSKPTTIYRSPRIGLDLSHPGTTPSISHPRAVFLSRPYRYFTHPNLLTSKGRPQTFLGVLQTCLETSYVGHDLESPRLLSELATITGLGEKTARRYLEFYKEGKSSGKLEDFVGAKGKGAGSSPATYLQMMGTLAQEFEKAGLQPIS